MSDASDTGPEPPEDLSARWSAPARPSRSTHEEHP
jgi:hypothetical protein